VFDDKVLQDYSPWLFDFIKTLVEQFSFENVALQRMTAQQMHCDPHAKSAPADELHILLTVDGTDHCLGFSSSNKIRNLDDRYRVCRSGSGGGSAAVKIQENQLDDALLLPRAGELPLQAVGQALLAGLDLGFEAQTNKEGVTLNRIVCVHGGVPGSRKPDSKSLDALWMSSSELEPGLLLYPEISRPQGLTHTHHSSVESSTRTSWCCTGAASMSSQKTL
jgi:hypothetical protein